MAMTTAEKIIIEDGKAADRVAAIYMQAVNDELFARGHHLVLAVQKFSTFLGLKELPKKFEVFVSIASSFLPMVCPELFMAKWLGESEEAVKRALVLSSALGNKKAKVIEMVGKAKEAGIKIGEMNERSKARKENFAKLDEAPGTKQIAQLDAAEEVVNQLIDTSRRAFTVWKNATLTLNTEFDNRLDHAGRANSETLEALAKRLLPEPPELTLDEFKQAETLYLYQIIAAWSGRNLTLSDDVEDWSADGGNITHDVHRHGLNDNQADTLMEWFGVQARRGKIFSMPPIINLDAQLQAWGVPMSTRTTKRMWTSRNQ